MYNKIFEISAPLMIMKMKDTEQKKKGKIWDLKNMLYQIKSYSGGMRSLVPFPRDREGKGKKI